VDGRNVKADIRWGSGDPEWYRSYAAELVALSPNAILAVTTAAVVALQKTSRTVPIVFVVVDPVGSGLVSSMARPGGNATGFTVPWLVAGPDDPTSKVTPSRRALAASTSSAKPSVQLNSCHGFALPVMSTRR